MDDILPQLALKQCLKRIGDDNTCLGDYYTIVPISTYKTNVNWLIGDGFVHPSESWENVV